MSTFTEAMRNSIRSPEKPYRRIRFAIGTVILVLLATSWSLPQNPRVSVGTSEARSGVASERAHSPTDLALAEAYDETIAAMQALEAPGDEDIRDLDARVVALTTRLSAVDEHSAAGWLNVTWGNDLGDARGRPDAAFAAFVRAENCFRFHAEDSGLAEVALGRAAVFQSLSRYDDALTDYATATSLFEQLKDEGGLARCASGRGNVFRSLSRHDEALAEYDRAASVFERLKDEGELAKVSANRGSVFMFLSRFDAALKEYDKAAGVFEKLADDRGLAKIAHCRGNVFLFVSRYDEALAEYEAAANVFRCYGNEQRLAGIAQNRATIFDSMSRYEDALAEYDEAAKAYQKVGNQGGLAEVAMGRGNVLHSLSRYDDALAEYDAAARVFAALGIEGYLAKIAGNRGIVLRSLSRYEEALAEWAKATRTFEKLGDEGQLAAIAQCRGTLLEDLSRHEEALAEYDKAARVFEELRDEGSLAGVAQCRGTVLHALGRYGDALAEFDKAALVFEKLGLEGDVAYVAHDRGIVFASLSRHEDALTEFERATPIFEGLGDERGLALVALARGGVLRSLSRNDEALAEYDKGARVLEALGDDNSLIYTDHDRGRAFRSLSRNDEALDCFARAAIRVETVLQSQVQKLGGTSSLAFRSRFQDIVGDALATVMSMPDPTASQQELAYRIFGTFLGLGTAELIAERVGSAVAALNGADRQRFQELARETGHAVARRDQLMNSHAKAGSDERGMQADELRQLVDKLKRLELETSGLIDRAREGRPVAVGIQYPKAATVQEVRSELDRGVALLEFAVEAGEIFAFVTTRSDQRLVALGDSTQVLEDVEQVELAMTGASLASPDELRLRRLGERLVDPLLVGWPELSEITTLLIAANGDLARLPFEILLVHDPRRPANSTAAIPLLRVWDMAYVHSGTVMRAMKLDARRRAKSEGLDFVAFGFPLDSETEQSEDAPKLGLALADRGSRVLLPGSAIEVLSVAKQFAGDVVEREAIDQAIGAVHHDESGSGLHSVLGRRFKVLLRADATESAFKDDPQVRSARVLHLACHAEADLISPAFSRLVLARSKTIEAATGQDGFVYARDLGDLRINAQLLVLSACSTNAGKVHPLEGITGLSRMGLAAGAEAVISTFWRVEDQAACELMVDFYKGWLGDHKTRIAAMCDAKRNAMDRRTSIRTWSAYALWDAKTK